MTLEATPPEHSGSEREDAPTGLPLLAAAMESAANAMAITDREGVVEWANNAFSDLTGYSSGEIVGRNIRILNSGRHPKRLFREMWQTLLRGRPWSGPLVNRHRDGTEYVHDATLSPVSTSGADITHFISVRQNIEAPTSAVEAVTSQRKEIAAAGQFACGIAPDLNGFLSVINKNAESLVSSSEFPVEAGEYSSRIIRAGEQAAVLAGWLLAFSRRQAQQFRSIDLNSLILGLRRHLQAILPQNIELEIALEPSLENVIADEMSLQEALIHLVVNARDAMPEGGKLTIETARIQQRSQREPSGPSKSHVLLRVTDTGLCADAFTRSRMFEPFYATRSEAPAAGLGLSAVYGIVKQAGGWISVYAEKGVGSSVEVFLPCANGPDPTAT